MVTHNIVSIHLMLNHSYDDYFHKHSQSTVKGQTFFDENWSITLTSKSIKKLNSQGNLLQIYDYLSVGSS